jgi:hypothetical protein
MHDDECDDEGRFELYSADGKEWFRLISRGALLLRSRGESTRAQVLAAVDRLQAGSTTLRACMSVTGRFYFNAQTHGGEVLATSRMFELPAERDAAMAATVELVRSGPLAIRDLTPTQLRGCAKSSE